MAAVSSTTHPVLGSVDSGEDHGCSSFVNSVAACCNGRLEVLNWEKGGLRTDARALVEIFERVPDQLTTLEGIGYGASSGGAVAGASSRGQ